MKTGTKIAGALLPLAVLAVVLIACEDTQDVITPSDATMNMWANPASVVLDPNDPNSVRDERGKLVKSTTVFAQLFDKTGFPLADHIVVFSTDGGRLGSQGPPGAPPTEIETDPNGVAHDTLTVSEDDPASIKISAQSSSKTANVTVTKQLLNCLPLLTVDAGLPQSVEHPAAGDCSEAVLTATTSSSEEKTCAWECGNGRAPTDPSEDGCEVTCCYESTATASVTATVVRLRCTAAATDTVVVTVEPATP